MVLPKHIHLFTSIREHVFVKHLYASNGSNENKQSPTQRAYHRLHETPHILQLLNLVFFCVRTWRQHIYPFFFFFEKGQTNCLAKYRSNSSYINYMANIKSYIF